MNGVSFWKKVGIVCSGMLALISLLALFWTIGTTITAYAWTRATKPIVTAITEERRARTMSDSLIIEKIEELSEVALSGR
jgi:hypothetical protein